MPSLIEVMDLIIVGIAAASLVVSILKLKKEKKKKQDTDWRKNNR